MLCQWLWLWLWLWLLLCAVIALHAIGTRDSPALLLTHQRCVCLCVYVPYRYGEFYLAELIEAQDPTNRALVSEVDGRACGLMALTTDMQLDVLQRCFELDAYNNLLKRTRAELAADAEAERVALRERSDWLAQVRHCVCGCGCVAVAVAVAVAVWL